MIHASLRAHTRRPAPLSTSTPPERQGPTEPVLRPGTWAPEGQAESERRQAPWKRSAAAGSERGEASGRRLAVNNTRGSSAHDRLLDERAALGMLRLYMGDRPAGIHQLVRDGAYEAVQQSLQKGGGKNVSKRDKEGATPLHIAAQVGRVEMLRLLMEKGASVEAEDEIELTPLHYASMFGQVEAVQVLLRQGANVLKKDKDGRKPSDVICAGIPDRRRRHTISGLLSLAEMKAQQEKEPTQQEDTELLHSMLERRLSLCSTPPSPAILTTEDTSTASEASASTARTGASRAQTQYTESEGLDEGMVDIYTGSTFLNNDVRHSASHLRLKEPLPGKHNMDIPYVNIFGD